MRDETSSIGRLQELDGLRALAIITVVLFHYFQRFPEFYPYSDSMFPPLRYGYLGVELFFMISGFVITISIGASETVWGFAVKRLARLWPGMIVCSAITFAIVHSIDTPFSVVRRTDLVGFLPSITFTAPEFFESFLPNSDVNYIDGVYWSLFVEVRFYFWCAIIGAMSKSAVFSRNALLAFGVAFVASELASLTEFEAAKTILSILFFPDYLHLFLAGILFSEIWRGRGSKLVWFGLFACFTVAFLSARDVYAVIVIVFWFLIFICLSWRPQILSMLRFFPLVWIGTISYPIYLLHQYIGVSILSIVPTGWARGYYILVVILIICAITLLAAAIYHWVETPTQKWIKARL